MTCPSAVPTLVRLKTRPQFLKIAAKGKKAVRGCLVLQGLRLSDLDQSKAKRLARAGHVQIPIYLGFTASKKVGNAVARNRAKRRLTAAARDLVPTCNRAGLAYVIIARAKAVGATHEQITRDLDAALREVTGKL